jgi:hypothetical protein
MRSVLISARQANAQKEQGSVGGALVQWHVGLKGLSGTLHGALHGPLHAVSTTVLTDTLVAQSDSDDPPSASSPPTPHNIGLATLKDHVALEHGRECQGFGPHE